MCQILILFVDPFVSPLKKYLKHLWPLVTHKDYLQILNFCFRYSLLNSMILAIFFPKVVFLQIWSSVRFKLKRVKSLERAAAHRYGGAAAAPGACRMSSLYLISWLSQSPLEKQDKTEQKPPNDNRGWIYLGNLQTLKDTKKETSPEQQMRWDYWGGCMTHAKCFENINFGPCVVFDWLAVTSKSPPNSSETC